MSCICHDRALHCRHGSYRERSFRLYPSDQPTDSSVPEIITLVNYKSLLDFHHVMHSVIRTPHYHSLFLFFPCVSIFSSDIFFCLIHTTPKSLQQVASRAFCTLPWASDRLEHRRDCIWIQMVLTSGYLKIKSKSCFRTELVYL